MKADRLFANIFRRGSRTFFTSSRFFPARVRRDIFHLYGFVRTADDFVDRIPQDREGFEGFRVAFEDCRAGKRGTGGAVIDQFLEVSRRCGFDPLWTDAFLDSMAMDLEERTYAEIGETLRYVYGSAEVIGLMMASILGLGSEALPYARLLGRAMQYINFLRDISEDAHLGRTYLPSSEWRKHGLSGLSEGEAKARPEAFRAFVREEVARYRGWQKEAERGYGYIPRSCRIPIRTAAEAYAWTARRIERDPSVVFRTKVRPSRARILKMGFRNMIRLG